MTVGILRLNVDQFGKPGEYNVQELGIANAIAPMANQMPCVFYLNKDVDSVTQDENFPNVYYLPHKAIGVHGVFDVTLLDRFSLDGLILFADNQLWQGRVIKYCRKREIACVSYWGRILSQSNHILKKIYTLGILCINWRWYRLCHNVTKTKGVFRQLQRLGIPADGVIHVGLDARSLYAFGNPDKFEMRRALAIPADSKILLYVGRLVPNKKPLESIKIFEQLAREDEKLFLMLIGDGILRNRLTEAIEQSRFQQRIRYWGTIQNSEMYQYFAASDTLINLCDVEIFGMAILEAMYYGCVPVARSAPGPDEYLMDDKNGYICKTDGFEEWKEKINRSFANNKRISQAARATVENHYLWDHTAPQFYEILQKQSDACHFRVKAEQG